MSSSLQPPGLQHAKLPCPSLSPAICSNLCPLSQWCYLTISSSATPLLLLSSVFASIRVFSSELVVCIRWPKHWSFSFSVSPSNEYSGLISFKIDWFDRLAIKRLLISSTTIQKHQFFSAQLSLWSNSHNSTRVLEKTQLWLYGQSDVSVFIIHFLSLS